MALRTGALLAGSLALLSCAGPRAARQIEQLAPGVRVIAEQIPYGRRQELYLPASASAQRPARLLIFLHARTPRDQARLEPLLPELVARGFALLLFTDLDRSVGWSREDINAVVGANLRTLGRIPEVDPRAPVLLGYSAGGQLALDLWTERPFDFGGIIAVAAYPVRSGQRGRALPLPEKCMDRTPLLAVVGTRDPMMPVWRSAIDGWKAAGVRVEVLDVFGRRHEWLFNDTSVSAAVLDWLDRETTDRRD